MVAAVTVGSVPGAYAHPTQHSSPSLTICRVGALQTAPILIAVVTAFLTMEAVKYRLASRKQARAAAAKPAAPA